MLQLSTQWESLGKSKVIWKDTTMTQQYFSNFNKLMVTVHISIMEGCFLLMLTTKAANTFIRDFTIFQVVEFKLWDPGGFLLSMWKLLLLFYTIILTSTLRTRLILKGKIM